MPGTVAPQASARMSSLHGHGAQMQQSRTRNVQQQQVHLLSAHSVQRILAAGHSNCMNTQFLLQPW